VRFPSPQQPMGARLATIVVLSLLLAGCDPSDGATCAEPTVEIAATVTDTAMDPSAISVCRGQDVTFVIASETDGVFHLHGYDDQVPAVALEPGERQAVEFTADVAGQFIIELHARSGQESTEIAVLTVNEP
jgi:hypothetical protein